MSDLSITLDATAKAALERVAKASNRPKEKVLAEAVAALVRDEDEIVAAILRGRADVDAGRTISHDEAMVRFRKTARGE